MDYIRNIDNLASKIQFVSKRLPLKKKKRFNMSVINLLTIKLKNCVYKLQLQKLRFI